MHFQRLARQTGLPPPKLVLDGAIAVSLPAGSDGYVPIAEKTFGPFGLSVVVTPSQVAIAPLVRTKSDFG